MAVEVDIDVAYLKSEIKRTYAEVSQEPDKDFIFPTGRTWAGDLGYPEELLARVPDSAVESYAGVANPFSLGALEPGERVLDLGCGAGTDTLVAAQMVAPEGRVTGIDMTDEMLAKARAAAEEMGATNVDLVEGEVERLPFDDASFDVVISNGVIDLIPESISGPVELPGLCWKQSTGRFWSGTGSSGSSPATSSRPTCARSSRTRAGKR